MKFEMENYKFKTKSKLWKLIENLSHSTFYKNTTEERTEKMKIKEKKT